MECAVEVKRPRRGRPPKPREEKIPTQEAAEEPQAAVVTAAMGKSLSWINTAQCHVAPTSV